MTLSACTNLGDMEIIIPQQSEKDVLNKLEQSYTKISEMTNEEREFLTALILRTNPTKLLEVGVSAGGSSIVMLNAIKNISNATLYSIDYTEQHYNHPELKSGYFVDNYPELKTKWKLYIGGVAAKFMDRIGVGIDFCLIDTMHLNPGEILDILMVLPYLSENTVLVLHDTNLQIKIPPRNDYEWSFTNNLLISAVHGKKLVQGNYVTENKFINFPNIAGIKLNADTHKYVFETFNLLTIKWLYLPKIEDWTEIVTHFKKFYNEYYINYLECVYKYQEINVSDTRRFLLRCWRKIGKMFKIIR